jgi:hypothetical protein
MSLADLLEKKNPPSRAPSGKIPLVAVKIIAPNHKPEMPPPPSHYVDHVAQCDMTE